VFRRARLVHSAENIEKAELLDSGKDLRDSFTYQLFFFDVVDLFGRRVKIHKDKIFAVVSRFVYRHSAADIVEQGLEFCLIFVELVLGMLLTAAKLCFFTVIGFHISP